MTKTKTKTARRRFQLWIDLLKGGAGGLGNKREGDNGGSDYRALPGKDEVDAMCIQPPNALWRPKRTSR